MKVINNFTLFFSQKDFLSNWFPCAFTVKGITFNCVEQFMMYTKSMLFGDTVTANKILNTNSPKLQKALGRVVKGYDDAVWVEKRARMVYIGCYSKFQQNPELLKMLFSTGNTTLVEASPYDTVWGVGLSAEDPNILHLENWKGANLLGEVLSQVRADLKATVSTPL